MITYRDIRVKYKQSIMGLMWAVLMPIIIVMAGVLVKYAFAMLSKEPFTLNDVATVSVKAVPWAFFVASIRFATSSLIQNPNLVMKIYFPKAIFPIASVFSQLFDFLIASAILAIILVIAQIGVNPYLFWVPILIAVLILMAAGLGILLSAASLFFRDVKYIVEVFLTFAIFFTPVFYEVEMFGRWSTYMMLNPVAPILEGLNTCIIHHQPPQIAWVLYSVLVSLITLVFSLRMFKKLEPMFAESI